MVRDRQVADRVPLVAPFRALPALAAPGPGPQETFYLYGSVIFRV